MPTPLALTPQAEGAAAELRAWIATLRRMRPRDSAIEEAIEAAEEELRRKTMPSAPSPPTPPVSWCDQPEAEAVLATWSEEDKLELERAKHAIVPLIVEDEESDGPEYR